MEPSFDQRSAGIVVGESDGDIICACRDGRNASCHFGNNAVGAPNHNHDDHQDANDNRCDVGVPNGTISSVVTTTITIEVPSRSRLDWRSQIAA